MSLDVRASSVFRIKERGTSRFVLGFEAAGLHAVAADLHVAPAAGVVLAGIEEQPAAVGLFAGAQEAHVFRQHQPNGAYGKNPKRQIGTPFGSGPFPRQTRFGPGKALMLASFL